MNNKEPEWVADLRNFDWDKYPDEYEPLTTVVSPTKGTVWITDGKENRMIYPDEVIPEGWKQGRTFQFSEKGREANLNQLKENNPNAKTYRIVYRDGTEETVKQLSTWARNNGYSYGNIKNIVYRTDKPRQFRCYNSPTYHIEGIYRN